jgi:3-oxoacyl-[acyl-carrier-protein] synthase I
MSPPRLGIADAGLATPLGTGKATVADALLRDRRARFTERSDLIPGRTIIVGTVNTALPEVPEAYREMASRNNRLALAALEEMRGSVDAAVRRFGRSRIAVVVGTSTSGIAEGEAAYLAHKRDGVWPAGFDYGQQETGSLGTFVARTLELDGLAYTVSTACSSSGKVFGSARRLIAAGLADAAIVGGADTLCRMTVGGFAALEAMSRSRCNPFSKNRDGINIGEGAAFFLLTPDAAPVELAGVGETSDAHHISAPDPEGRGARDAMRLALSDGGLDTSDIAYLNLHGTGTPLNDVMEGKAVHDVFGTALPISSTKAMTGHMLGAAAACEAAFLWLTLNPAFNADGRLPPHLWDGVRDPDIPTLALVPAQNETRMSQTGRHLAALSNSFAFGGSNVAIALARGGQPS